jgi:hypothetical protein
MLATSVDGHHHRRCAAGQSAQTTYDATMRLEAGMKVCGIVLTVVGALMVLSSANLAITTYDLKSSHDLSKLLGGLGVSAMILLSGVGLIMKSRSKR